MEFTKEEIAFLLNVLDQIPVKGIEGKMLVIQIMGKLIPFLEENNEPKSKVPTK